VFERSTKPVAFANLGFGDGSSRIGDRASAHRSCNSRPASVVDSSTELDVLGASS